MKKQLKKNIEFILKDKDANLDGAEFEITLNNILKSIHEVYGIIGLFAQKPEEFILEII